MIHDMLIVKPMSAERLADIEASAIGHSLGAFDIFDLDAEAYRLERLISGADRDRLTSISGHARNSKVALGDVIDLVAEVRRLRGTKP